MKKLFTLLLVPVMLLSMLSMGVMASAEGETPIDTINVSIAPLHVGDTSRPAVSYNGTGDAPYRIDPSYFRTLDNQVVAVDEEDPVTDAAYYYDVDLWPLEGYAFAEPGSVNVIVEGGEFQSISSNMGYYTVRFRVSAAPAPATYTVTVNGSTHGSVSADKATAAEGETVTLIVRPDDYYRLKSLTVTDASNNAVTVTNYSFTMPASNVTVTATFETARLIVESALVKESTIYAGEISVDGVSQISYLYSPNITVTATVFENLKKALAGTTVQGLVPTIAYGADPVNGFFRYTGSPETGTVYTADTDYSGGISEDWSSVTAVAGRCFTGIVGTETAGTLPAADGPYEESDGVIVTGKLFDNGCFYSTLSVSDGEPKWGEVDGIMVKMHVMVLNDEGTTIIYTTVNVSTPYTVTANTPTNGSVSADKTSAAAGDTVTLTVTPDSHYELDTLTVKDASNNPVTVNADNTFTMPASNVTVTATFKEAVRYLCMGTTAGGQYSAQLSANPAEAGLTGSMNMSGHKGDTVTLTATPDSGYTFKGWYQGTRGSSGFVEGNNGTLVSSDATYSFTLNENTNLQAVFEAQAPAAYTVTVTDDGRGTATADVTSGAEGTEVTLTAAPNTGYQFKEWQVVSGGVAVTDNKFTIGTENVEIKAVFSVSSEVSTETVVDKNTTVYAGEILLDGASQLRYLYSDDITVSATVFDNLKDALADTAVQDLVPSIVSESTAVNGVFRYTGAAQQGTEYLADTNYFGGISEDWSSTAAVAGRCFTGTVGTETNDTNTSFDSVLSTSISSNWIMRDGSLLRLDTVTFHTEKTTVVYTTVNVTTPATYTVTVTDGGRVLADQTVAEGGKITRPADPVKEGSVFAGWYGDAAFTTAFDFDAPITADTTVYARWTPASYVLTSVAGTTADAAHTWTKGSGSDVVLTVKLNDGIDHSFTHFTGVQIDGAALVSGTDYSAEEGSTVVTLKAAALERLSTAVHTVKVLFDNGEVSTALTVAAPTAAPTVTPAPTAAPTATPAPTTNNAASPRTGDGSAPGLWLAVMLVSGLGLTALAAAGKKRRPQR